MTETPPPGGAPEAISHAAAESPPEVTGSTPARRVLDPLARVSEVLFGLIMVLTFTLSLNATAAGRDDVRAMLIGALGCNLAWGIIDAVMFLMGTRGERALQERTVRAVQSAESADRGREMIAAALPPLILPALSAEDLERIRLHLVSLPVEHTDPRLGRQGLFGRRGGLPPGFPLHPSSGPAIYLSVRRHDCDESIQCHCHRTAVPERLRFWPALGSALAPRPFDGCTRPLSCRDRIGARRVSAIVGDL